MIRFLIKIFRSGQAFYLFFLVAGFSFFSSCKTEKEPYLNTDLSFEERAADLVSRMTLKEKISQMKFNADAVERLGVPEYNWWNESLHGVGRAGLATVFPQAIGMAAMWDDEEMFRIATAVSDEARAKHHDFLLRGKRGIYQGLTFWTPNINIFRDPRWGRGMETYGEDPYSSGELAVDFIHGLQGDDEKYLKLVATAKHFMIHSGPESNRHQFDVSVSARDSLMTYTPQFKKAVQEAGVYSVMCAYNRVNGQPCCGSKPVADLLRDEWGFDGYIVSDCWALQDFYMEGFHEVVPTVEEAAAMAANAGTDLNCGESYPALVDAVGQGLVSEEQIDVLVTRLMLARMKLGMFDPDELVPYSNIPFSVVDCEDHQQLALESAQKSMVLLKNEQKTLPLDKNVKSIAVIGPNANREDVLLANYNGYPSGSITPFEGIKAKLPDSQVGYAQGCPWVKEFPFLIPIPTDFLYSDESLSQNGLKADYFGNYKLEGKPLHSQVDQLIDFSWRTTPPFEDMEYDNFSVRWSGVLVPPVTGEYALGAEGFSGYSVFLDGDSVAHLPPDVHHPRTHYKKFFLQAGEKYNVRVEFTQNNTEYPMMKFLWDAPAPNMKKEALELASASDIVIMCMGLSPSLEGEEMPVKVPGFLGGDRTLIQLPAVQTDLIKEIMELGKPTVLVLLNGSALAINWEAENVPAILEAWYPGQAGGKAIADVLFGDYNPAGRLPVTFYKSVDQLPPFENYNMDGRTYRYFKGESLFPFGHGLSYTTFNYSNLKVFSNEEDGEEMKVEVEVTNNGEMGGEEVAQLYISHPGYDNDAIRSLQGFERFYLEPGEAKTISFSVTPEQMAVYHPENGLLIPKGKMKISVGGGQPVKSEFIHNQVLETVLMRKDSRFID
ncbi:glycoside hydrolase family 3 C-terminal domain-containing protein [Marinilabilia sp.]|uniref:glycoside hydrolase family 3 C-terminal domain-containing protein n=1 Tax=Marinilabilia sp. TaxID=2021252 RepID=UPI0025C35262|nr:glycoside hydrolase family 3 C-terminal domain-containing protein [Marinilabilia sp.]